MGPGHSIRGLAVDRARWLLREAVTIAPGRLGGLAIGALIGGLPGAGAGLAAGWAGDVAWRRSRVSWRRLRGHVPDRQQCTFAVVTCVAMGALAKADGRVSQGEIEAAQRVFALLELDGDARRVAIDLFRRGKRRDVPLRWAVGRLRRACAGDEALAETFLSYQRAVIRADGAPAEAQQERLRTVAGWLGYDTEALRRVARSATTELRPVPRSPSQVLGIPDTATPDEIRRAYRRLVSRHHPDRLQAQGCSDAEIRAGAARTHAARRAYEELRRLRGFR